MIIAVTVTYNRSETLKKTIEALVNQDLMLDKIIIVDNASSKKHKEKIKAIKNEYNNLVDLYELKDNFGGAGGFYYGMKYAFEKYNPDFYWIMDDDAYPEKNCLKNLIQAYNHLKNYYNIGCLCPIIFGIDNKKYQLYHHKFFGLSKAKEKTLKDLDFQEYKFIDSNAFVGPLFHKKVIKEVGFPDKDLFIYGDDTEYTYRVSRKFDIVLVKNAVINHQDPPIIIDHRKYWWKNYYSIRNRILFIKKYSKIKYLDLIRLIAPIYVKYIVGNILNKDKYFKFRYKLYLKAIKDGLNNSKGKTLDPKEYFKKLEEVKK